MNLVAYCRVSTDSQLDGFGLEIQQETIEQWAAQNGHVIVGAFHDEGVSGTVAERLALGAALEVLRAGEALGLVVLRLDRLARDLVLQEQILADIRRMGAQIFSTSEGEQSYLVDDPSDPSRKLIRQVLGAIADYERQMVSLRLSSGRRRKAANGGYVGGLHRYGYRADPSRKELVPDEREQRVVARILSLRASGRTLSEIAAALDREGYPPRRAARWNHVSVSRIIKRTVS